MATILIMRFRLQRSLPLGSWGVHPEGENGMDMSDLAVEALCWLQMGHSLLHCTEWAKHLTGPPFLIIILDRQSLSKSPDY